MYNLQFLPCIDKRAFVLFWYFLSASNPIYIDHVPVDHFNDFHVRISSSAYIYLHNLQTRTP